MKCKIIAVTILLLIVGIIGIEPILCETLAEPPSNFGEPGAGTEENPFLIATLANLRWLSNIENFNESKYLTDVIRITLRGRPNSQQLEEFLSDYEFYLSKERCYHCCNIWYFLFNGYLVGRDELVQILKNDHRVADTFFENDWISTGRTFYARYLNVKFIENSTEEDIFEFVERYSDYGLIGWQEWSYNGNEAMVFTFDDKQVFAGDFLPIIRNDDVIESVNLYNYGWFPGAIAISFHEWVTNVNEAIEHLLDKYFHYNIEIEYGPFPWSGWIVFFDQYAINEFLFREQLIQEEIIRTASFYINDRLLCGDDHLFTTDIVITPIFNTLVYPNPVRNRDVIFKLSSVVGDTSYSPHIHGNASYSPHIHGGGKGGDLNISIYNIRGQLIKRSNDFQTIDGENVFVWNRRDNNNQEVASGVYFFRVKSNEQIHTGKLLILK